ncbi:MAG: guanylate kinase [Candidatus Comchoanobacterales bacterium]
MIIIVSAPSGAGKTSLVKAFLKLCPEVTVNVSHTTRNPRPGEVNGKDYHFVSHEAFLEKQKNNDFIESEQVFECWYGSDAATVSALSQQQDVILEIDWQGARVVRNRLDHVWSVFILPPNIEALEQRLMQRGDDAAIIKRRMQQAEDDMRYQSEYDFVLVNDHFDTALEQLVIAYRKQKQLSGS